MTTQFVPSVPVDSVPVDTVPVDAVHGNTVPGNTATGDAAGSARVGSTRSAGRAYERKWRREGRVPNRRLTATGSPITAALTRVPFVMLIIFLLAGAIVGVLWLNTMTDEAGLQASQSRRAQIELKIKIEAGQRNAAALNATPRIAEAARGLGLVQAGDAAVLKLNPDGSATVIGTPAPAMAPAAAAPSTAAALSSAPPVATTASSPPAAKTAPGKTPAAKPAAANTPAVKTAATKTAPGKTPAAKPAAALTASPKTPAAKPAPPGNARIPAKPPARPAGPASATGAGQ